MFHLPDEVRRDFEESIRSVYAAAGFGEVDVQLLAWSESEVLEVIVSSATVNERAAIDVGVHAGTMSFGACLVWLVNRVLETPNAVLDRRAKAFAAYQEPHTRELDGRTLQYEDASPFV